MPLIPEEVLAKAAFGLLSSSSVERYVRVANEIASSPDLRTSLETSGVAVDQLLVRAQEAVRALSVARQREPQEFELALLLQVLSVFPDPEVDALLSRIALSDRAALAWPGAQAKHLLNRRPSNGITTIVSSTALAAPVIAFAFAGQAVELSKGLTFFDATAHVAEVSDQTLAPA